MLLAPLPAKNLPEVSVGWEAQSSDAPVSE